MKTDIEIARETPLAPIGQIAEKLGVPETGVDNYGRNIAKIDEIPAAGDFGNSAPATEKHGYVVEAKGTQNLDAYSNPNIHDPATQYMRIWLEEATDNGFKLRYEFPFTPAE